MPIIKELADSLSPSASNCRQRSSQRQESCRQRRYRQDDIRVQGSFPAVNPFLCLLSDDPFVGSDPGQ